MTRCGAVLADPGADPPVYPWRSAPGHLATRAQLAAAGLRPGRQGVQGLLLWASRRGGRPRTPEGHRYAYLFDIRLARPRLPVSAARAASLARALAARQTCPRCGKRFGYVLSARLGYCNPCISELGLAA